MSETTTVLTLEEIHMQFDQVWDGISSPTARAALWSIKASHEALRQALTEAQQQRDAARMQRDLITVTHDAVYQQFKQAESRLQQIAGMRERIKDALFANPSSFSQIRQGEIASTVLRDLLALLPAPGQE